MAKKSEGRYLSCVTNGEFYFNSAGNLKCMTRIFFLGKKLCKFEQQQTLEIVQNSTGKWMATLPMKTR